MRKMINQAKTILSLVILTLVFSQSIYGQACAGSQVTLSIVDAKRTAPNKFTFELWVENTGLNTERISAYAGGIMPNVALGAGYTIAILEQPSSLGWEMNNFTPNAGSMTNIRWTNNPNPAGTSMIDEAAKIAKFEITTNIMPTSLIFGTVAPFPTIQAYCSGNPNSNTMTAANGKVAYTNNNAPVLIDLTFPIKLDEFTTEKLGEKSSLLNWGTVRETNSSHFGIERSENGSKWENIGRVQAAGNSKMERVYSYVDNKLPRISSAGKVLYYRLKLVDQDGWYQYSDIRTVTFDGKEEGKIVLYPNPATKLVNVDLSGVGHNGAQMELSVMDVDGKLVIQRTIEGADSYELDVAELTANVYQIRVSQGDRVYQTRLVKVD